MLISGEASHPYSRRPSRVVWQVTLVDLPGEDGGASERDNATLTLAAETLRGRYRAMCRAGAMWPLRTCARTHAYCR